jgi:NNP family nitrate/nitrite transporter-like MFS transporter
VGALARPIGGWLADKIGGARVTQAVFVLMIAAVFAVIGFLPHGGQGGNFQGFFAMFLCLFALTGIGNGSTFMQVSAIFLTLHKRIAGRSDAAQKQAVADATKEAAAVLGFSGAIGAYGGFFIPKSYGTSIALTGGVEAALYAFIAFYVTCVLVNWWFYARKGAEIPC